MSSGIFAVDLGGGAGAVGGTDYDQMVVSGDGNQISLDGSLALNLLPTFTPPVGTVFTIIDNVANAPITGAFSGLPDGTDFMEGNSLLQINYSQPGAGTNNVTLTVMAVVWLSPPSQVITEGTNSTITIQRADMDMNQPLTVPLVIGPDLEGDPQAVPEVDYTLTESTSTGPIDFSSGGDITFDPGVSSITLALDAPARNIVQPTVGFTLSVAPGQTDLLSYGPNGVGGSQTADVQILNNPPVVTESPTVQLIPAGSSTLILVSRTGGDLTQPITVYVVLGLDGEGDPLAMWNINYTITAAPTDLVSLGDSDGIIGGTITFAANEATIPLAVTTFDDPSGGSGGSLGPDVATHTGTWQVILGFRLTVLQGGTSYISSNSGSATGPGGGPVEDATADVRILYQGTITIDVSGGGSGSGSGSGSGVGIGSGGSGSGSGLGSSSGSGASPDGPGEITGFFVTQCSDPDDPGDVVLSGVLVELEDADGNILATTTTDGNGLYDFSGLSDGTYQIVTIDSSNAPNPTGYSWSESSGTFTLNANQVLQVDFGIP